MERKERLRKTLSKYAVLFTIGVVYLIISLVVGYGIPCFFNKLTGLKCPGCGATRMLMDIARLNFKSAFYHNPFLFTVGPILIGFIAYYEVQFVKSAARPSKKWNVAMSAILVIAIAFGVIRNIVNI